MAITFIFTNRDFRKKSSDGRQKKGGEVYKRIQSRLASIKRLERPAPMPSIHAVMRAKGLHGPVRGTKAFDKWDAAIKKQYADGRNLRRLNRI